MHTFFTGGDGFLSAIETVSLKDADLVAAAALAIERATENAALVDAVKYRYRTSVGSVVGFAVAPKSRVEKLPVILFFRGGNREFGKVTPAHVFLRMAEIARHGYVVLATQYPGVDGGDGHDDMGELALEAALALRDVASHLNFADTERIGVTAGSRGAVTAYMALAKVDWIRAAEITGGSTDLFEGMKNRPYMRKEYAETCGDSEEALRATSAIHFVDMLPKNVPILLMHGACDWRVLPSEGYAMSAKLLEHKVPHRFVLFEGADHSLMGAGKLSRSMRMNWFDRYVRDRKEPPTTEPFGK